MGSNIQNVPYYKKLSDRVYFRILNLPGELKKGEIFLDDHEVIDITDYDGNIDAVKTTYFTAGKLQLYIDKGIKPESIGIEKENNDSYISIDGKKFLTISDKEADQRYQLSSFKLAFIFSCKLKKALGDLKKYPDISFSRQYIKLNRGDEYFANNLMDDAYLAYRKAWKIDRDYMLAYYSMGSVAFYLGKYDEAMEFLEKSTTLNSRFSRSYFMLAKTSYKLKDFEKSLFSIKIALKLNPKNSTYADFLAGVLKSGDNSLMTKEININFSDLKAINK